MDSTGQPLPPPDPPNFAGQLDDIDSPDIDVDVDELGEESFEEVDASGEGGLTEDSFFADVEDPSIDVDEVEDSIFADVEDPSSGEEEREDTAFADVEDPSSDQTTDFEPGEDVIDDDDEPRVAEGSDPSIETASEDPDHYFDPLRSIDLGDDSDESFSPLKTSFLAGLNMLPGGSGAGLGDTDTDVDGAREASSFFALADALRADRDSGEDEDEAGDAQSPAGSFFALADALRGDRDSSEDKAEDAQNPAASFFALADALRTDRESGDDEAEADADGPAASFFALADALRTDRESATGLTERLMGNLAVVFGLIEWLHDGDSDGSPAGGGPRYPNISITITIDDPADFLKSHDDPKTPDDLNLGLIFRAIQEGLRRERGLEVDLEEVELAYWAWILYEHRSFTKPDAYWRQLVEGMAPGSSIQYGLDRETLRQFAGRILTARAALNAPDYFTQFMTGFSMSVLTGTAESGKALAQFAWAISPVRAMIDPDGWLETWGNIVEAQWHALTHPVEFAKAAIDWDTLTKDPGRWLGHLIPGVLLGMGTNAVLTVETRMAVRIGETGERLLTAAEIDGALSRLGALDTPVPVADQPLSGLNNVARMVDEIGEQTTIRVPDTGGPKSVLGTRRHSAAETLLDSATANNPLVHHYYGRQATLKSIPGFSPDIADMTVREFIDRFGLQKELLLEGRSNPYPVRNPDGRIGDLIPDLLSIDDDAGQAFLWDLTSKHADDHFTKNLLYGRALTEGLPGRIRQVKIVETYHYPRAKRETF